MKFLVGSQNFGLDLPDSDKDYMEFVYPELGDLCKPIPTTKERSNGDGSITKVVDIRALPSLFYKANLDTLQLLYSKEVVDGGFISAYFDKYEKEIISMNIPRLYQSIMGSAKNRAKSGKTKDLAHIIFGYNTLLRFAKSDFKDLRRCFEHEDRNMYLEIRESQDENYWLEKIQVLESFALEKKELFMSQQPNEEFKEKMNKDIALLVIEHLKNTKN